jgi:hypothetical protein
MKKCQMKIKHQISNEGYETRKVKVSICFRLADAEYGSLINP